jgi:S-(hydroxymethyl)glutathione dehydrogenase/alcohol dehydrogenase
LKRRHQREKGDHVIPLYRRVPACPSWLSRKTNLYRDRATQGQGLMPDGSSRFSLGGKPIHHYMGTSTFANTPCCRDRGREFVRRPVRQGLLHRCGVTPGSALHQYRKVDKAPRRSCWASAASDSTCCRASAAGADMIIGVDINNDRKVSATPA